jgi:hypothetical protein
VPCTAFRAAARHLARKDLVRSSAAPARWRRGIGLAGQLWEADVVLWLPPTVAAGAGLGEELERVRAQAAEARADTALTQPAGSPVVLPPEGPWANRRLLLRGRERLSERALAVRADGLRA